MRKVMAVLLALVVLSGLSGCALGAAEATKGQPPAQQAASSAPQKAEGPACRKVCPVTGRCLAW